MPKPTVYLDSTIPSVYHDDRTEPERVRWRTITRAWWDGAQERYTLCTSQLMLDEIARGGRPDRADARLALVRGIRVLEVNDAVHLLALHYRAHRLMPRTDAVHVAAASCHRCDLVLTWDLRHMANPRKTRHILRVNAMSGLPTPRICTPETLIREAE
ncbi:MAG TPA: hypothetical protein VF665_23005 [Longimicrobium sp.]|jgi:predicted nucleic acid-binding protein|uniref:PIN domain-containing protein n=1 Tax=Longimicrobium sp. TaxID=2029185 RepID=UPI002ED8393E